MRLHIMCVYIYKNVYYVLYTYENVYYVNIERWMFGAVINTPPWDLSIPD